jgi:hypothetical protein
MPEAQQLALRDIHLPDAVSWWPPAPGWWALAGLVIVLLVVLWALRAWRRRRRLRNDAIAELARICDDFEHHDDELRLVRELSVLLRRIAISYYPRSDVAALTGDAWLRFLDESSHLHVQAQGFLNGAGKVLNTGPYQAHLEIDPRGLIMLCRRWIEALPAKPVTAGYGEIR